MNFRILIQTIIIFFAISIYADAQETKYSIQYVGKGKYEYQGKVSKLHEMKDIFSTNVESTRYFKKFDRSRKAAKRAGIVSLIFYGATPVILASGSCDNCEFENLGVILIGVSTFLIGTLSGMVGLILKIKSNYNKRKALKIFNRIDKTSIDFRLSPAGAGLVFSF